MRTRIIPPSDEGNYWVSEVFVNVDKGYRFGESEPYETYTDNLKRLFRDMQREYGRCQSAMYIDAKDGKATQVGWVFSKRMQYEDCDEFYTREVWVEVFTHEPNKRVVIENIQHPWAGVL